MGIELFGAESGVFICIACVMSYLFSGHSGIYLAQRINLNKYQFMGIKDRTVVEESSNQPDK
jgi:hypothetical protein